LGYAIAHCRFPPASGGGLRASHLQLKTGQLLASRWRITARSSAMNGSVQDRIESFFLGSLLHAFQVAVKDGIGLPDHGFVEAALVLPPLSIQQPADGIRRRNVR
jgi:hypothetical protein